MKRLALLRAICALLEALEWDYIEAEKRRYEGGFVPEDGSLESNTVSGMLRAARDLLEAEGQ